MLRVYSSITKLNVSKIKVGRADEEGSQKQVIFSLREEGGIEENLKQRQVPTFTHVP